MVIRSVVRRAPSVCIVGGGPAGYVAAIKAAQLGFETTNVEKRPTLGGTCLNVGCIPSKALLQASHQYHEAKHGKHNGFSIGSVELDLPKMMKYKEKTVTTLTKGIEGLFKKNKVNRVVGEAKLTGKNTLSVDGQEIKADHIIIATGSTPVLLPHLPVDEKRFVTSTGALEIPEVPKKLLIIGAGVIGLELGCVWGALGAEIEVIEMFDRVCPTMDHEVGAAFKKMLEKDHGMKFHLSAKVIEATNTGSGCELKVEKGGETLTLSGDYCLVGIGRKPVVIDGLEAQGVKLDRGKVDINDHWETAVPGIYAIGDCVRGPMLAHKGEDEGVKLVELLAARHGMIPMTPHVGHMNYDAVPSVVYTHPEVAWVGKTEEELKEAGIKYKKGSFPFMANSRARAVEDTTGFVKVLSGENGKILGAHIIGPSAGELIATFTVALEHGAAAVDLAETCFAHPTLSEAVKEACLGAAPSIGKSIHI
jgi:dihydrolipoamide dehydrogenase